MRTTNWDMTPTRRREYENSLKRGDLSGRCPTLVGQWFSSIEPETTGCWRWVRGNQAYGGIQYRGRTHLVHRLGYQWMIGEIPPGLHLDHLCRNTRCVNPTHLEPVTPAENNRRSESLSAQNLRKTHCRRGHPFDEANTYRPPGNPRQRICRQCSNGRTR